MRKVRVQRILPPPNIISALNLHKNIKKGGDFPRASIFCRICAVTEFRPLERAVCEWMRIAKCRPVVSHT